MTYNEVYPLKNDRKEAVFCYVDDILYSELPGADFIYTQQIGCGGSCCDYTYKKKK